MKKLLKALAAASVLALVVTSLAACANSEKGDGGNLEKSVVLKSQTEAPTETEAVTEAPTEAEVNFDQPDITITEGDYDGMKAFTGEMLAGQYDGKVVKVTGISTRSMMSPQGSILQSDGNGSKFGCIYTIKDAETIDVYPAEDARVELTGVVKTGDYDVRYL